MHTHIYNEAGHVRTDELEMVNGNLRFTATDSNGTVLEDRLATADEQALYTAETTAETTMTNREAIEGAAETALTDNASFLALASPTNSQVLAQIQSLTKQSNALIRLQLERLESASDV